jgi:hypothetical protein
VQQVVSQGVVPGWQQTPAAPVGREPDAQATQKPSSQVSPDRQGCVASHSMQKPLAQNWLLGQLLAHSAAVGLVRQHWLFGQVATQGPPLPGQHWPAGHFETQMPFEQQKPVRQELTQRTFLSQHFPFAQGTFALQTTQTCRVVSQRRPSSQSPSLSQPQVRFGRQTWPSWLWAQLKQVPPDPQRSLAVPSLQTPRLLQQPAFGQRAVSTQVGWPGMLLAVQHCPLGQNPTQVPFCRLQQLPAEQAWSRQLLQVLLAWSQSPLRQSPSDRQVFPLEQGAQFGPPQSTSVSRPFSRPSSQRARLQLPPTQPSPARQTRPQRPQLLGSVRRSVSQPSFAARLQLPKPELQVKVQRPLVHPAAALGTCGQTFPQVPQLFGSRLDRTQVPFEMQ